MTASWTDAEDRLLARSVFGTDDWETARDMVLDWTAGRGFGPATVSAVELSVGAVATVALADGSGSWPRTAAARRSPFPPWAGRRAASPRRITRAILPSLTAAVLGHVPLRRRCRRAERVWRTLAEPPRRRRCQAEEARRCLT